jgi:hypothetical protein
MLIDFLKTKRSRSDLQIALDVLREFKELESKREWFFVPFMAWSKFEQLEEYLDHLVTSAPLQADTIEELQRVRAEELKRDGKKG